jgi:hypothetical protein
MIKSNLSKAQYTIAALSFLAFSGTALAAENPKVIKAADGSAAITNTPSAVVVDTSKPVVKVDSTDPTKPPVVLGTTTWGGIGWGIGLAANFDVTGARVGSATVVNNIVRIQDGSNNVNLGFVLEAHYFLRDYIFGNGTPLTVCPKTLTGISCVEVAYGPFVAIEVGGGTSSTISATGAPTAYALGMMVGLRHPDAPPNQSWNFGLGLRVDPKAQILGDGIVANQPLPVGESTTVRLKTEPRVGIMLLSSFSF